MSAATSRKRRHSSAENKHYISEDEYQKKQRVWLNNDNFVDDYYFAGDDIVMSDYNTVIDLIDSFESSCKMADGKVESKLPITNKIESKLPMINEIESKVPMTGEIESKVDFNSSRKAKEEVLSLLQKYTSIIPPVCGIIMSYYKPCNAILLMSAPMENDNKLEPGNDGKLYKLNLNEISDKKIIGDDSLKALLTTEDESNGDYSGCVMLYSNYDGNNGDVGNGGDDNSGNVNNENPKWAYNPVTRIRYRLASLNRGEKYIAKHFLLRGRHYILCFGDGSPRLFVEKAVYGDIKELKSRMVECKTSGWKFQNCNEFTIAVCRDALYLFVDQNGLVSAFTLDIDNMTWTPALYHQEILWYRFKIAVDDENGRIYFFILPQHGDYDESGLLRLKNCGCGYFDVEKKSWKIISSYPVKKNELPYSIIPRRAIMYDGFLVLFSFRFIPGFDDEMYVCYYNSASNSWLDLARMEMKSINDISKNNTSKNNTLEIVGCI